MGSSLLMSFFNEDNSIITMTTNVSCFCLNLLFSVLCCSGCVVGV